jgi:hypothetical protein
MTELRWQHYPVAGMPGNITGNFGADYGGYKHRGTDVGVNIGTPVVAPADGRSVTFLNNGSFGGAVCLEHPGTGWFSLYAHLAAVHVVTGQWVTAGEIIGLSGNTGMSTGPHLHWQVCSSRDFPIDIRLSRDAMKVPFEEEDDEMTPDQERLLLLAASVLGGWSNGAQFTSVEEALAQFEKLEANDQRVFLGFEKLEKEITKLGVALGEHIAEGDVKVYDAPS